MSDKPKLLFLVSEDWYFYSHRLQLAVAAREKGYEVVVVTRVNQHAAAIRGSQLTLIPLQIMRRSSICPLRELASLLELWCIYRRERPDLVHHVGLKSILYGSLVARIVRVRGLVNALAGRGFVFTSERLFARLLRPLVQITLFYLLKHKNSRVIVQNESDRNFLTKKVGCAFTSIQLIRGAGVDLSLYNTQPPSVQPPLVVLIARMLWDKGVGDFIEAANRICGTGVQARFALIGIPDPDNPTSVSVSQLRTWHDEGKVEWWGYCSDIPAVLTMASIVCLPTFYGEGVPKALIEAMAGSRAIVTTDIPGCRDLVVDGRCGIIVAPRDVPALSGALRSLIIDPDRCRQMGVAGRLMAEQSLSLDQVLRETLALYADLVPTKVEN